MTQADINPVVTAKNGNVGLEKNKTQIKIHTLTGENA
jgi:hypothetical protein